MSAQPRFRSALDQIEAFHPAGIPVSPDGRSYRLAGNESPFGPLPSVVHAIAEASRAVNRYPDNGCVALTEEIAVRHGVPAASIAVGCGSVGVTQMLLQAVGEPGGEAVYAWRSFEAYPPLSILAGLTPVPVPLRQETHDLAAMADAITPRTRVVFVCNPNNPTGTVVDGGALEGFLARVPPDCLVVLDEAYHEYVRDATVPDGVSLLPRWPNLAVLRTFSKAYGLAGLRVGYLVAHPAVAAQVRKTYLAFSVNHLAQVAAIASLHAADELLERVEIVTAERERVRAALLAEGWTVPPSSANFVWLRLGASTADFAAACRAAGVAIRPFPGEGARVTIGDNADNEAFLAVAKRLSARPLSSV